MRKVRRGGYVPGWDYEYRFHVLDRTTVVEWKKKDKKERHGFWMVDRSKTLYLSCPVCGTLMDMKGFYVEIDGTVDHEECIVCPGLNCRIHFFAILDGWEPARRKAAGDE